ncbi:peptidase family M48-domain-containing protein [Fomes fomentarius]|nr:peptidase family M48-domain-containing protein [Fomes fomentarius]
MFTTRLSRCAQIPPLIRATQRPPPKASRLPSSRRAFNGPGGRPRYVRFNEDGSPKGQGGGTGKPWDVREWDTGTKVMAGIGTFAVGYYLSHLEQVPETGRWRFMDISPKYETMLAEASYQGLLQEFEGKVLPPNHPLTRHIRRVAKSILEASNLGTLDTPEVGRPKGSEQSWSFSGSPEDMPPEVGGAKKWRLFVVNDDSVVNAMAAYGNIVVFTGILPVAKDEHGLAAILGHEIGHAVARHASELYSSYKVVIFLATLIDLLGLPIGTLVTRFLYQLPNSRKQEFEADIIGLRLSSRACFDPAAVPEMFDRLGRLEQAQRGRHIDFLTTHPASEKRSQVLREMLPEAYAIQAASPTCGSSADHMAAFQDKWTGALDPNRMSEVRWG